jgi:uncharacterized protein (TIGR03435 family)
VKDQTGLPGGYDFEFEVGTVTRKAPEASAGGELPTLEESGPTIFAALLKLGLRIQERKIMLPALAIDRVERPVKN